MFTAPRRTWLSASVLSPNAASYVAYLREVFQVPEAEATR